MVLWENKTEVKKGNLGERIVKKYLEDRGWVIYGVETSGKHAFDKLCIKDKKKIVIVEIKTKARMKYKPATGFNYKNYLEYKYISNLYGIDVWLFFVDEGMGKIYGNSLNNLKDDNEMILDKNGIQIIIFPLNKMKTIKNLNNIEIEELKTLSQRNYDYNFVE